MPNPLQHQNGGSRPIPDPTVLTTAALRDAIATLKEFIITRTDGMVAVSNERYRSLLERISEHHDLDLRTMEETKKSLRELLKADVDSLSNRITGFEKEFGARLAAHVEQDATMHASDAALVDSKFDATIKLRESLQNSMKEAVDKAERANDARFEDGKRNMDRLAEQVRGMVPASVFTEAQKAEQAYRDGIASRMGALETANAQRRGKDTGIGVSWGAIVGAGGIIVALIAAISFLAPLTRQSATTTPTPQVVYVPAQPGTMLPSSPSTAPVPR